MNSFLAVAAGGAIGAAGRYGVGLWATRVLGHGFPWGTLIANILGCLAMGVLIRYLATHLPASNEVKLFLTTGLLGGFTTFSTFSLDFATLLERGDNVAAFSYLMASVVISLIAVFVGLQLGRILWS